VVRNPKFILLLSLLLVGLAGVLPSLFCSDWAWFSRSGALLVIIGAFFTWAGFIAEIQSSFKNERAEINENIKQKRALLTNNSFGVISNPDYASGLIEKQSEEKLYTVASNEKIEIRICRRVEIVIMVMGTLIWAYGDIINKFA
jgi:hypothetical protein